MNILTAEILGTFLMILLGNGVVAACVLKGTKASGSGWIVITTAWALAVYVGVVVAGPVSGAHLNPVVTISLAVANKLSWAQVGEYLAGEFIGAMLGALAVWLTYKKHFEITCEENLKRACFCTEPAIRSFSSNFFSEFIGSFVLMFVIFHLAAPSISIAADEGAAIGLGSLGALPVALLVWVIGLSLGATTGYAINPARDLGPRIMLAILPVGARADWAYAIVPVLAPILGGVVAAVLFMALN